MAAPYPCLCNKLNGLTVCSRPIGYEVSKKQQCSRYVEGDKLEEGRKGGKGEGKKGKGMKNE